MTYHKGRYDTSIDGSGPAEKEAEIVPIPSRNLVRAGFEQLPRAIIRAGEAAAWRFVEFFTATIRNKNTRAAYAQAVGAVLRVVRKAPRPDP